MNSCLKEKCISTKALNTVGVKLAGSKLGVSFKKDQRVMWHMQTNTSTAIVQTTNYLNMWEHSKLHIIVLLCVSLLFQNDKFCRQTFLITQMIKRKEEVSKINSLRQRLKYQLDASLNFYFYFSCKIHPFEPNELYQFIHM